MSAGQSKITSFFVCSSPSKTLPSTAAVRVQSPKAVTRSRKRGGGKLSLKGKTVRSLTDCQTKRKRLENSCAVPPLSGHDSDVEIIEVVPSKESSKMPQRGFVDPKSNEENVTGIDVVSTKTESARSSGALKKQSVLLGRVKRRDPECREGNQSVPPSPVKNPSVQSSPVKNQSVPSSPVKEPAEANTTKSPYYLENLVLIVNSVKNGQDWDLFDRHEQSMFCEFLEADEGCQKLLARLLQRKHMWRRTNKIAYPDIASDVTPILLALRDRGFLEDATSLADLNVVLKLLSPSELKILSQVFKLKTGGQGKGSLADSLLEYCSKQQPVLFGCKQASLQQLLLKRALAMLGAAWRLCDEPRDAWRRLLRLFSLGTPWDMEEAGETPQVYGLVLVSAGTMVFPNYKVLREQALFETRQDLVRYEESRVLETELIQATLDRKWDKAKQVFCHVEKLAKSSETLELRKRDEVLAPFLRHYTTGGVYTRCRCLGVDVLQRLKQHHQAVKVLRELLGQNLYCQSRRGHWWDRLSLNLEVHLGKPVDALKVLNEALADPKISPAARHALVTRANRLVAKFPKDVSPALRSLLELENWGTLPKVEIEGRLAERMVPGRTNLFSAWDGSTTEVISVEEVALRHYNAHGYPKGVHGEGSTFHALFGLLCWDVIYMSGIPDAFRSIYQALPMDLHSESFFISREEHFIEAFRAIRESTTQELEEKVAATYEAHCGKAGLVQWERFSCADIQEIVRCLGPSVLSSVCELLARQFRHRRSGLPDLLVWNPETAKAKAAEVKGPGDTLSPKQVVWLRELLALGVDCEVCRVTATSSKRIQKRKNGGDDD